MKEQIHDLLSSVLEANSKGAMLSMNITALSEKNITSIHVHDSANRCQSLLYPVYMHTNVFTPTSYGTDINDLINAVKKHKSLNCTKK